MSDQKESSKNKKYFTYGLDFFILFILVFPQIYYLALDINPNQREEGLYIFLFGLVIGLPYFFRDGCLVFKILYNLTVTIGLPRKDWSLLLYSVGIIIFGALGFIDLWALF